MINTTIQLRQNDTGASVYANGDYENSLSAPIKIEAGDRVAITNAFVDTTDYSNQQIVLDNDLEINMNILLYLHNQRDRGTGGINIKYQTNLIQTGMNDYIMCRFFPKNPAYERLTTIEFRRLQTGTWGGFIVEFTYQALDIVDGVTQYFSVSVDEQPANVETVIITPPSVVFRSLLGISVYLVHKSGAETTSDKRNLSFFNTVLGNVGGVVLDHKIFLPYEVGINFVVPAGRYNPNDLCSIINREVVEAKSNVVNNDTGAIKVENSGILTMVGEHTFSTSGSFIGDGKQIAPLIGEFSLNLAKWGAPQDEEGDFYQVINPKETPNLMIGTNLFELEYNQSTNLFQFSFLHFPLYHKQADTDDIIIDVKPTTVMTKFPPAPDPPTDPKFLWCSKNSGIAFTHLSPSWFWGDGALGFNLDTLLNKVSFVSHGIDATNTNTSATVPATTFIGNAVNYQDGGDTPNPISAEIYVPLINGEYIDDPTYGRTLISQGFTNGINVTQGLIVTDSMVIKAGTLQPYLGEPYATDVNVIIGDSTQGIIGGKNALNFVIDSGYYLIEMNTKYESKLIGQNFYNNIIQGVINRYYSINTYTAGGQGLEYIHPEGAEPILMNSIHTRILMPDGSLANLGDDNSVFLTITKQPPLLNVKPTNKEEKKK